MYLVVFFFIFADKTGLQSFPALKFAAAACFVYTFMLYINTSSCFFY